MKVEAHRTGTRREKYEDPMNLKGKYVDTVELTPLMIAVDVGLTKFGLYLIEVFKQHMPVEKDKLMKH